MAEPASRASTLVIPVTARDHADGPEDALITVVEYGDHECPHCAEVHEVLRALRQELPDTLRLVFRHFPLESHPHAARAAEASEAAARQGLFWEMHDRLFKRQDALDEGGLRKAARKVGVDLKRFDRDMAERAHAGRVRADYLGGLRSGVKGTPTFFLNGVRYRGSWAFEPFVTALVAEANRISAADRG